MSARSSTTRFTEACEEIPDERTSESRCSSTPRPMLCVVRSGWHSVRRWAGRVDADRLRRALAAVPLSRDCADSEKTHKDRGCASADLRGLPHAGRLYEHSALSKWLNAGAGPRQVAERAGNGVEVVSYADWLGWVCSESSWRSRALRSLSRAARARMRARSKSGCTSTPSSCRKVTRSRYTPSDSGPLNQAFARLYAAPG